MAITALSQFITWMAKRVGGTSFTRADLLDMMNKAQNEIYLREMRPMRIVPDPFLATTDSVYQYAASSSLYRSVGGVQGALAGDIRRVKRVFSYQSALALYNGFNSVDFTSAKPNILSYQPTRSLVEARVDSVDSLNPSASDCSLIWWEGNNPGTSTTTWRAEAYRWPAQLTGEAQTPDVPREWWHTLWYFGVLKDVEETEYGRNDFAREQFEKYLGEFAQATRMGAQSDLDNTPYRDI